MPYKLVKNKIYSKATGKWKLKQTCKNVANAKRALGLLRGLESGSIKPSQVGKGKYNKKKGKKRVAKKSKYSAQVRKTMGWA
jgi:hypothetical protein